MPSGAYTGGENKELLKALKLILQKLSAEGLLDQYSSKMERLLDRISEWTANLPEYSESVGELKEWLVVVNLHE